MVRKSQAQRDAQADAWGAAKANSKRIPYEFEMEDTSRHELTVYAVCAATGDRAEIEMGRELEKAPTVCPLCGIDGSEGSKCSDNSVGENETEQVTLTAFSGGDE